MGRLHRGGRRRRGNPRLYGVIRQIAFLGTPLHVLMIPAFFHLGVPSLAALNAVCVLGWLAGIRANERGAHDAAIVVITAQIVLQSVGSVAALGWGYGFQYYLFGTIPFAMFNTRLRTYGTIFVAVITGLLFIGLYAAFGDRNVVLISREFVSYVYVANAAIGFAGVGMHSLYFRETSIAVEEEIQHVADTDALTGLPNRRSASDFLDAESQRAKIERRPLVIAIADIDHFKTVNDRFGHECGDGVLAHVASVLRASTRSSDVVARWGGEEFLFVARPAEPDAAEEAFERVRIALAASAVEIDGRTHSVTVTIGVGIGSIGTEWSEVVRQADAALYEGKRAGRNRVVVRRMADEEESTSRTKVLVR